MSLHPIRVLDHVIGEYRNYLQTEFRAKDPQLQAALERELDAERFLAQEPFFQAHRPFKNGCCWKELPLEPSLARVMENRAKSEFGYIHQTEAIRELLSPEAKSVVVTTGTGSGKSESFLLPVIQNAFEDATRFRQSGLTAILIYPMNALANDQKLRIDEYLEEAGFGNVVVEQYDRSTTQKKRQEMRANPPHVLLTNYMMLEYLLVRPADRENIFANHRCRFLVLDEVHTYRGILGSNIALLVRRLKAHLTKARQDWKPQVTAEESLKRFPSLIPVGTSATIKSIAEDGLSRDEVIRLRDDAVQEFFGTLTGVEKSGIRVLGEELQSIVIPADAAYPSTVGKFDMHGLDVSDPNAVRVALSTLAGKKGASVDEAARSYRLLWDLNRWLIRRPMSISQLMAEVRAEVPERRDVEDAALRNEIESTLTVGAALPDGTPGALRLRAHRFVRGGWKFHRCINPACGKLYPLGEERCRECAHETAPLFLCRNCGADYLGFFGDPLNEPLVPGTDPSGLTDWMLYEQDRFSLPPVPDDDDEDDDANPAQPTTARQRGQLRVPGQIRNRPVQRGSFNPWSRQFSVNPTDFPLQVTLAPGRGRCLCCGGTAGSRSVITPVALGTSAAVKVLSEGLVDSLSEANENKPGHDGKERLLIFSDSRQDAAHQARFVIFASRYDRMRRRVVDLLERNGLLSVQRIVELLAETGVANRDNPYLPTNTSWLRQEDRERIQAWEEAPLLDELSVSAGYRGTLFNLGLVSARYNELHEYVEAMGQPISSSLGIQEPELEFLCRVILDEMRTRGALSRPMLQYHPANVSCPQYFQKAEWERRIKTPQGYALTPNGDVVASIDAGQIPEGIKHHNAWRRQGAGGRSPSLERIIRHLLQRMGGIATPSAANAEDLLNFLLQGGFVKPVELFGARTSTRLLQVNAEAIRLELVEEASRVRCEVCSDVRSGATKLSPCPRCHGLLMIWPDVAIAQSRHVARIKKRDAVPLEAKEHTAQITTEDRATVEENFKAPNDVSKINLLACSPTLEMGIDVGGLDAVVMRNIPPRPDNYAQRGGRAGRRSRIGIVVGYARSTPHDQYFYDKPREMIAGEVPAPAVSLGNRDVIVRHLYAIVFGATEPGLAGKMVEYISPTGELKEAEIKALIDGVVAQTAHTVEVAKLAWGNDVLQRSGLDETVLIKFLSELPKRIRYVFEATARQVHELRQALEFFAQNLERGQAGTRAAELIRRILGIPSDSTGNRSDADDRSSGYPLRRFAEFGLLPGYEFPSEPASLRLLGDDHEEEPISVTRRFGIGQFQPDAHVYARRRRWKVVGLDTASPWNPRVDSPTWNYRICGSCGLRYHGDEPRCPRCRDAQVGQALPGYDFAGFVARRDENPILDEEERFAERNLVRIYPQWSGDGYSVVNRWSTGQGWSLRLSRNEQVRWLNEGPVPTQNDIQLNNILTPQSRGYLVCPSCGRMTQPQGPPQAQARGRRNPAQQGNRNNNGHADNCPRLGANGQPIAISTSLSAEILRLIVPVPRGTSPGQWQSFGVTLGFTLLNGIRHHFMLDSAELDVELEGPWTQTKDGYQFEVMSLAFIDPSLGGSGYLKKIAENFHTVAARAIEHLDHAECDSACYRCLKTYNNQRYHDLLSWPQVLPALDELAHEPPFARPLEIGDLDDPAPWLDAYRNGVGSPLELKFLRLFQEHGFRPQKQVAVQIEGTSTVTVADFAVPERRLAIYVDGAAFHSGSNARRDRYIRSKLRGVNPPWRVEELRAADLASGEDIVRRLRSFTE